jgi:hypothetical protein
MRAKIVMGALALVVVSVLAAATSVLAGGKPSNVPRGTRDLTARAEPIEQLCARDESSRFGELEFRGGLDLRASSADFGGISGLSVDPGTDRFLAISDAGLWIAGRFEERHGRLVGVGELVIAPMLGAGDKPLMSMRRGDTESLAVSNGIAYVGIERTNEIVRFPFARDGLEARGEKVPLPGPARRLPRNQGLEAVGLGLPGTPLAGILVAIAEGGGEEDAPTEGFLIGGRSPGRFKLRRSGGYDITDLAFLPDGDILVLERRFSILGGIGMRLRRIGAADLRPGATVDGEVLADVGGGCTIDNMEALAVSRSSSGEVMLTIMSDDNYSLLQRNLVLRFALVPRGS